MNSRNLRQSGAAILETILLIALLAVIGIAAVRETGAKISDVMDDTSLSVGGSEIRHQCDPHNPIGPDCG